MRSVVIGTIAVVASIAGLAAALAIGSNTPAERAAEYERAAEEYVQLSKDELAPIGAALDAMFVENPTPEQIAAAEYKPDGTKWAERVSEYERAAAAEYERAAGEWSVAGEQGRADAAMELASESIGRAEGAEMIIEIGARLEGAVDAAPVTMP